MKIFSHLIILFVSVLFIYGCNTSEKKQADDCTVIIGAFEDEIDYLVSNLTDPKDVFIEGLHFTEGYIDNKMVIVGISGIGKVNASMTTALVISNFKPKQIIFTGIAGGLNPDIHPGDIIMGEKTVQHDLQFIGSDTLFSYVPKNPITGRPNPIYFSADSTLLAIAKDVATELELSNLPGNNDCVTPKIIPGIIASGDAFIASNQKKDELIARFHADAVEMEGAAVAQVCYQLGIPCIIIRSISDSADDKAKATLEEFYKQAAQNSAELVMEIVRNL